MLLVYTDAFKKMEFIVCLARFEKFCLRVTQKFNTHLPRIYIFTLKFKFYPKAHSESIKILKGYDKAINAPFCITRHRGCDVGG